MADADRLGKIASIGQDLITTQLATPALRRTGVINVCTKEDPRLACGSIFEVAPSDYVWLAHIDRGQRFERLA